MGRAAIDGKAPPGAPLGVSRLGPLAFHFRPAGCKFQGRVGRSFVTLALSQIVVLGLAFGQQPQREISISLRVDGEFGTSRSVELRFVDAATREAAGTFVAERPTHPAPVAVLLPPPRTNAGWVVSATADGLWSPLVRIPADHAASDLVTVKLVNEGRVDFLVDSADRAIDTLDGDDVRIVGRVGGRRGAQLQPGVYGGRCQLDSESRYPLLAVSCPFARGETADLRVSLGPFLPLAWSGVVVGQSTDLGVAGAVRGASLGGTVSESEEQRYLVALRRQAPTRLDLPWSTWTDADGSFLFEGLAPGEYDVRLIGMPADRWTARLTSLSDVVDLGSLREGPESTVVATLTGPPEMEQLELMASLRRVSVDETGRVQSRGPIAQPPSVAEDGLFPVFSWHQISVGSYELLVEDGRGNRWLRKRLEVFGSDRFFVNLEAVRITGRLFHGSKPLDNSLVWFGGLWGVERVALRTRSEGQFGGLLPRAGYWPVQVTPAPRCDPCSGDWSNDQWEGFSGADDLTEAGIIEVEPNAEGIARVSIRLPAAEVLGRVLRRGPDTGDLEPVKGASVAMVAVEETPDGVRDDALPSRWHKLTPVTGEFRMTGVPKGQYDVYAEAETAGEFVRSRTVRINLPSNDDTVEDLDLELEERRRILVRAQAGVVPVGGARLRLRPVGVIDVEQTGGTAADGSREFSLPFGTEAVEVLVAAQGFGTVARRIAVPQHGPVEVELSDVRGSLRVPPTTRASLVTATGISLPMKWFALRRWQVAVEDDSWVVHDLAAGAYSYCPHGEGCVGVEVVPWAESGVATSK